MLSSSLDRDQYTAAVRHVSGGPTNGERSTPPAAIYRVGRESTYIQEPPFFVDLAPTPRPIEAIEGARVLVKVGDSVTTNHISPAGSIKRTPRRGST